ncbi:Protein of unknown function [Oceanospirillum multiglobuliferum]|uniref:DUF3305 domain-containing protein n=1 Tax=Oceanospirillum multiglobuliferum TaxID=64969 RepID=A0A1T4S6V8_9GAMM|nr:DUF3305 domain-containing protein [Oceanospirillum multiglobuliferum]OPX54417.1 hypothetical protein BTE48_14395 [Oceanospirillum multiglobuliferum]SKA24060.1 Protein of unknown function [Oceanospirillum multiglobuliferum]
MSIHTSTILTTQNCKRLGVALEPIKISVGQWQCDEWQVSTLWPEAAVCSDTQHPVTVLELILYRDERMAYRFNLDSVCPHLFVLCDEGVEPWLPVQITACQDLAASWLDGEQKVLEYPMPEAIQCWIEAFLSLHGELLEVKRKKQYAGCDELSVQDETTGQGDQ